MKPGDKIEDIVGNKPRVAGDPDIASNVRKSLGSTTLLIAASLSVPFALAFLNKPKQPEPEAPIVAPVATPVIVPVEPVLSVAETLNAVASKTPSQGIDIVSAQSENKQAQAVVKSDGSYDVKVNHDKIGIFSVSMDAQTAKVTIDHAGQKRIFDIAKMKQVTQVEYADLKTRLTERNFSPRISPMDSYTVDGGRNFDLFVFADGRAMLQMRGFNEGDPAMYHYMDPARKHFSIETCGVRAGSGDVVNVPSQNVSVINLDSVAPVVTAAPRHGQRGGHK